ncbi:hypothetical protein EVAR_7616_1 [Eumeta japonica]|uniref:Uncharacterized protein n=1 Tax=Eumeta variegata TaxID=151549 RepID=A0A4C1TI59_EUMVA|nr:hypothetical protein EVAR_7616_1 [Eumeta japonica]
MRKDDHKQARRARAGVTSCTYHKSLKITFWLFPSESVTRNGRAMFIRKIKYRELSSEATREGEGSRPADRNERIIQIFSSYVDLGRARPYRGPGRYCNERAYRPDAVLKTAVNLLPLE